MVFKENSIFTKIGRLQRRINRTEKFIKFLSELDDDINSLIETCDRRLAELKVSEETIDDVPKREVDVNEDIKEDSESDIIDKFDKAIEEAQENLDDEDDDEDLCEVCKVCNKSTAECDSCTFNEIDCDENCESCEYKKDLTNVKNVDKQESVADKYEQEYGDDETPRVQKIIRSKKVIELKKNQANKKVVVNTVKKPRMLLNDEEVKTAMRVMVEDNTNLTQTLYDLNEAGVELTDDGDGTCLNKNGSVALSHGQMKEGIIDTALFRFTLPYTPHGSQTAIYNQFISELKLKKVDPTWKSIGLGGKACMVQIDDEIIAVNMNLNENTLYVTFVYNVN